MSWLTKILSSPFDKIIDSIGDAVDKNVTNDEERMLLTNELVKIQAVSAVELENIQLKYEKEVSTRHANDMQSDSWLSKNIRPMTLISLTGIFIFLSVSDGNWYWNEMTFDVKEKYLSIYEILLMMAYGFYFTSRGVEKIAKMRQGEK